MVRYVFGAAAIAAALSFNVPAAAAQSKAAAAAADADPQADPERLALAREIAKAFWPDGTVKQMMSSMAGMRNGIMADMMNKTPKDLGVTSGKDGGKTLGQLAREKDPNFEERLAITNRVMMDEIGNVMASVEPQLREGMATLYARRFSKAELTDILAFFRTPSGKAYASQVMPMMSDPEFQKSMAGISSKMMQALPGIMEKVKKATAHLPPPPKDDEKTKPAELPSS